MNASKTKIAIISYSLGGGGAERFGGLLSCILNDLGYEIHNIIITEKVDYDYCGILYNLGEICKNETFLTGKIKKGILLKRYLQNQKIDIIIDNRSRNVFLREWFTKWIYGKRKTFYVIHSYNLKNYLPDSVFLAKLLYKKAEKLICVSKAIEAKVKEKYNFKNTIAIYNPIDLTQIKTQNTIEVPEKFILFYGRLEEKVKNFSLMLEAFSISKIYEKGYKLLIMGNGPDADFIQKTIAKFNLDDAVKIIPFQNNPFGYVKKARFTVLTSHYEGFPMSIIESLAWGTPVVSVNCNSGPAEIIVNEQNGLLVENYNSNALANAMIRLAEDDNLYHICKENASKSVEYLSLENISKQWQQILA
ncbi:MAG: glycosyltransferase [Flavobacterium sp.]